MNHRPSIRIRLVGRAAPALAAVLLVVGWRFAFCGDATSPASATPDALQKQFGLKPGPGRELVLIHCLPCHSTAIVAANHLKRERWAQLVEQMQEKNGMRPIDAATRSRILDYLETAQRPDDSSLTAGKQSPWAAPLYQPNPFW